jgi:hypothetical protein
LLPVLIGAGLVAASGRRTPATCLLVAGAIALHFWLAADLVLQGLTGNHVLDYLPYVHDALTSAGRNHVEWAGDTGGLVWRSLIVLGGVIVSALLLVRASRWLSSRLLDRFRWLGQPHGRAGCAATFALAAFASVPAQALFSHPLLLRRLHTALPVDLSLFVPKANDPAALALLVGRREAAAESKPGVRIVSVVPDPAGDDPGHEEATLHNFTAAAVSLDDWHLVDRKEQQHILSGSIQPGEPQTIVFPEGGLELDNDGDELRLIDAHGQVRHRVKYKVEMVKYGSVIAFREEGDLDDFLLKLNQGLESIYYTMRKDVLTPRPLDQRVRLDAKNPPNVIYLVLESFRDSAVSPELMQRLDAWSRQGLRMGRHYAGSNSSHLGLFTLLYSRSPLVYFPTVNAGIPPQTTYTLRESGYELSFITSGDCTNFRKMDRFLNQEQFDCVIVEDGADWHDWPQRDRRTLARVQELVERADRPQFVMAFLMSTHFPYAFPPEWDRHQPSGADVVDRNNWRSFDASVLYNRYQNAALSLEHELMRLIDALDPQRNIIVITGDHGESMSEDGALAHASRGSEVQTRVPLVMVGPGLPARVIEQPTTHSDVLPTLLHALAGHEVPIQYAHGRDVLGEVKLGEQVMICPYRWKDPYDLILVRGPDRMQFKIRTDRAAIEAYGFCDTSGNLDLAPTRRCSPRDAMLWTQAFRSELLRIAK